MRLRSHVFSVPGILQLLHWSLTFDIRKAVESFVKNMELNLCQKYNLCWEVLPPHSAFCICPSLPHPVSKIRLLVLSVIRIQIHLLLVHPLSTIRNPRLHFWPFAYYSTWGLICSVQGRPILLLLWVATPTRSTEITHPRPPVRSFLGGGGGEAQAHVLTTPKIRSQFTIVTMLLGTEFCSVYVQCTITKVVQGRCYILCYS